MFFKLHKCVLLENCAPHRISGHLKKIGKQALFFVYVRHTFCAAYPNDNFGGFDSLQAAIQQPPPRITSSLFQRKNHFIDQKQYCTLKNYYCAAKYFFRVQNCFDRWSDSWRQLLYAETGARREKPRADCVGPSLTRKNALHGTSIIVRFIGDTLRVFGS